MAVKIASGAATDRPLAPKIYYFHPLLAGPLTSWSRHIARCRDIGFDYLVAAPLFAPGRTGDLFLTGDHERVHSAVALSVNADDVFGKFVELCKKDGLRLLVDVVLARVSATLSTPRSSR